VYGRKARTPLDILYQEWREEQSSGLRVNGYVIRLKLMQDVVYAKASKESSYRMKNYVKGKTERTLEVGSLVLCRIPGLRFKLGN